MTLLPFTKGLKPLNQAMNVKECFLILLHEFLPGHHSHRIGKPNHVVISATAATTALVCQNFIGQHQLRQNGVLGKCLFQGLKSVARRVKIQNYNVMYSLISKRGGSFFKNVFPLDGFRPDLFMSLLMNIQFKGRQMS